MLQALLLHLWCSAMTGSAMPQALGWTEFIEAESAASLLKPAHIVAWPGASGGKCVRISRADVADSEPEPSESGRSGLLGSFSLKFTLPEAGRYMVWARLQWHCACSRSVMFGTTASALEAEAPCAIDSIASEFLPRVWHWIKVGTADFAAGMQTIDFAQKGHLALVDAIALSTDAAYTPPGYEESRRDQTFLEIPEHWQRTETGGAVYFVGDTEFSDFVLTAALDIPPLGSTGCSAGVGFCTQAGGAGYTLLLRRTANRGTNLRLAAPAKGLPERCLAEATAENTDRWNAVGIIHSGNAIRISLDGVNMLDVHDSAYASGKIQVIATGMDRVAFEHLQVRPLASYQELFAGDWLAWPSLAGTWRTAPAGTSERDGRYLFGAAENTGLVMLPWIFGDTFSFSTDVSVMKGVAGIAFNAIDQDCFTAVTLESPADLARDETPLRILAAEDGQAKTVLVNPAAASGQWHRLTLDRDGDLLSVSVDGRKQGPYEMHGWKIAGKLGLFVGNKGAATFARVEGHETPAARTRYFSFERSAAIWSLCHWRNSAGKSTLRAHPDLLLLSPQAGEILFELRRPVPVTVSLTTVIPLRAAGRFSLPVHEQGELSLPLPVLHGDSCFGIRLLGKDSTVLCEAAVDYPNLRGIAISQNGAAPLRKPLPSSEGLSEIVLYLRLGYGVVEAGIEGLANVAVQNSLGSGENGERRIALFASNMSREQQVQISEITVAESYPSLNGTPSDAVGAP